MIDKNRNDLKLFGFELFLFFVFGKEVVYGEKNNAGLQGAE